MKREDIEQVLRQEIARLTNIEPEAVDISQSLGELGIDSMGYVEIARTIKKEFKLLYRPETLFEHYSVQETVNHITQKLVAGNARANDVQSSKNAPAIISEQSRDIAIIGAALRLPGADDLDAFWKLIAGGESALSDFPPERLPQNERQDLGHAFLSGGFVDDADAFDASFFGISPREATAMDPQQRMLLECAWQAFENAGYRVDQLSGSDTAVFVGASSFDYHELLTKTQAARTTHIGTGVSHAILANRISQYFNLKGASEAIDTACASSMVALLRGVEGLRRGENRLALVGGVNLLASRMLFQVFADAGMLSRAGLCLPFDDAAAGYIRGEGAACVLLKPAQDAISDGDRILAIIKGGAVRHSGRTQSLTAPNPEAQADVICAALEDAAIDPISIGYIEAHGTGTALGDPIEMQGLHKAFSRMHEKWGRSSPAPHCFIGSVKAQIGHLEAAAGLAGVLKAVAALTRRAIPASPYLTQLNRHIELDSTVFRIPQQPLPWEFEQAGPEQIALSAKPRRAGVSSFGFGGTNTHIVLEEAPPVGKREAGPHQPQLFVLSAKTAASLDTLCLQLAQHLAECEFTEPQAEQNYLEDVSFTLRSGRTPLPFRVALIAASVGELIERLQCRVSKSETVADLVTHVVSVPSQSNQELDQSFAFAQEHAKLLDELARRWTEGNTIDWQQVLPRGNAEIVSLAAYPFARERFWANGDAPVGAEQAPIQEAALYASRWVPTPFSNTASSQPLHGTLLVLVAGPNGQGVSKSINERLPQHPLQLVLCSAQIQAAQSVSTDTPNAYAAVLDLTALDLYGYRQIAVPDKLDLLRRFIGSALKRGESLSVIQATHGLQAVGDILPTSLSGAEDAAFFEYLGAEYKRCRSKSIDFADELLDAEKIAAVLIRELQLHDENNGLAYVGEERFVRNMRRIGAEMVSAKTATADVANVHPEIVLITGGTGDIGMKIALDLAQRGCRAVLLTGRRALSSEKQAMIRQIERSGAVVEYYLGDLQDVSSLRAAIDRFRAAHGVISHVFHCAGTADRATPAFFQKTAMSIEKVMAPKIQALQVLHALFEHAPPQAFILFSSVSAAVPRLAAGVLDYAAANRYLDLFAQYQHAHGNRYYRSIQWTRWKDLGLARGAGAGTQGRDQPLAIASCLKTLHAILHAGDTLPHTVCVLAAEDSTFDTVPIAQTRQADNVTAIQPTPAANLEAIRDKLRALLAKELELLPSKLDDTMSFEELGVDSIVLMGLIAALETWTGQTVEPQELINRGSITAVAAYLAEKMGSAFVPPASTAPPPACEQSVSVVSRGDANAPFKVAVIGLACRFPGAADQHTFWRNLQHGVDSVGAVPASRWQSSSSQEQGRAMGQWGGFLDDIEWVDPKMFGMNAADAADVDPLVRLFTECSLAAAGESVHGIAGLRGRRVGVFAGARAGRYAERIVQPGKHSVTGVGQNFVAAHVSHLLDLHGPSLVIDSACSSSLAAIHLACQSLGSGDAEMALAGGVEVLLDDKPYQFLSAAHALSPDGRCRPFDARANGFVPGEGVGCVLLKPLEQALVDGDPVYAVIDGSAMNNDGHTLGVTTPGVDGQVDVIQRALRNAGIAARDISYVEAHGTGTLIGDPIELQSLARAFQDAPPERCAVGSVKSNLGHLLSAAGVASFIKVALSLHHETLPPTLHCEQPNPRFDFESTPFFPICAAQPWKSVAGKSRRAGISAFGFGKTNVHMILSERPQDASAPTHAIAPLGTGNGQNGRIYAWHAPHEVTNEATIEAGAPMHALLSLGNVVIEELEM